MLDVATQKSFQERFTAIRTLEKDRIISGKEKGVLNIRDIGKNSFFEYRGNTYFVRELNQYEETSEDFTEKKGYFVTELTALCLETGQTLQFEWEYDDALEVVMTLERYSFRNLADDAGDTIDADDLDKIADDKDVIVINNEKFWYEDDWASLYYRGNGEEKTSEKVYMYEFENENQSKFLTIEEWSGSGKDEYQIYTSAPVDPSSMVIISKGDV